jgi:hypothetical protein
MKTNRIVACAVLALPMMLSALLCPGQEQPSPTAARDAEVIFTIGKEDKSDREFLNAGWYGKEEFVCRPATDWADQSFPAELHIHGAYESYGVVRVKVLFELKRSYTRIVLRLARGGDETTVVRVDGQQTYHVTNAMLGSAEGFVIGSYELDIGGLEQGEHSLEFTVAEDGKGNGAYQWDALRLFGM